VIDYQFSHYLTPSEQPTRRIRRIPRPFHAIEPIEDDLNYSDIGQSSLSLSLPVVPARSRIQRVILTLRDTLQTTVNSFGLSRLYPRRPSFEPDRFIPSELLARTCPAAAQGTHSPPKVFAPPYPFSNMTVYRLMSWMNSGTSRVSETKVAALVKDVILAEDFDSKDLQGFSVRRSLRELDQDEGGKGITFPDDWIETTVTIDIPTKSKEDSPRLFSIPGFHFRPLVEVVRAAFADAQAGAFHLMPFKRLWNDPLDGHQERIYDELYTSDAWLGAQDDLHKLPKEPGCSLERVIAGLMFFSDATHLANFGTAKAWPLYAYFGNLTKYVRSSPTSGSCHLVGFLPSVSPPHCHTFSTIFRLPSSAS
jgi:Plavaka transposase